MMSGTSMAAPHVSGLAALILSAKQSLTPAALRQLLVQRSEGSARNSDSAGKANAQTSVAYVASGIAVAAPAEAILPRHGRFQPASAFAVDAVHATSRLAAELNPPELGLTASSRLLPLAGRARSIPVTDFATSTGSRKSPLDLYFEDVGGDSSRHFDTQIAAELLDFA
jgi:subtilisin family serine protease